MFYITEGRKELYGCLKVIKKNLCNRVRIWKKNPSPWRRSSQPRPSCPVGLHLQSKSKCEEFQDDNLRALRLKDGGEDFSVMDVLTPTPSQHCALKWEWGHLLECANHQRFHVFFLSCSYYCLSRQLEMHFSLPNTLSSCSSKRVAPQYICCFRVHNLQMWRESLTCPWSRDQGP